MHYDLQNQTQGGNLYLATQIQYSVLDHIIQHLNRTAEAKHTDPSAPVQTLPHHCQFWCPYNACVYSIGLSRKHQVIITGRCWFLEHWVWCIIHNPFPVKYLLKYTWVSNNNVQQSNHKVTTVWLLQLVFHMGLQQKSIFGPLMSDCP